MCCRYHLEDSLYDEIRELVDFEYVERPSQGRDVYPSETAVIISEDCSMGPGNLASNSFAWGLQKSDKSGLLINARAETIREKPSFSKSIETRRCIVPVSWFYEWDPSKQKVSFYSADGNALYLAAIYDEPTGTEGKYKRFCIITTDANESVRPIHDRMPLIIPRQDIRDWICNDDRTDEFLHSPMPELNPVRDFEQLSIEL